MVLGKRSYEKGPAYVWNGFLSSEVLPKSTDTWFDDELMTIQMAPMRAPISKIERRIIFPTKYPPEI